MPDEQKRRILQIFYEERSQPLQTLDREELAERIGKPWPEIQFDVAALEAEGYLATKRIEISSRIFHLLSITAQGVKFVEKPAVRKIDVFISSPSDVSEERQIAKSVLAYCNGLHSIAERYFLRSQAYEQSTPAEVGNKPQAIVDRHMMKAGSSDLFICMLWHRMGTPVTHEETGERYQSGTEYEFMDAYRHNQLHGKPYILLYWSKKPYPPEMELEQSRSVEAFFKRFEGEHADFKGLYKTYQSNKEFEDMLRHDLDTVLSKNLII